MQLWRYTFTDLTFPTAAMIVASQSREDGDLFVEDRINRPLSSWDPQSDQRVIVEPAGMANCLPGILTVTPRQVGG